MTPLHWAVEMDHIEVVHYLLAKGADPHVLNKFEKSSFDIAESNANKKMLLLLKASINCFWKFYTNFSLFPGIKKYLPRYSVKNPNPRGPGEEKNLLKNYHS